MKKVIRFIGRVNKSLMMSVLCLMLTAMIGLPYWLWYRLWLYNDTYAYAVIGVFFISGFIAFMCSNDDNEVNEQHTNADSTEARRRLFTVREKNTTEVEE